MLRAHLWKEWREQRGMLLALVGLLVVLAGIAFLLIDRNRLDVDYRPEALPRWLFHIGVLAGVVVLASELVPGESRRGQLGWLLRLPQAMRHAFFAKWIVLLLGTLLLALAGAGAGWVIEWLVGQPDSHPGIRRWLGAYKLATAELVLGIAFAFAPWAFAVSCWMPRGTLVVPAAILLVAPLVQPLALIGSAHAGLPPLVVETPWALAGLGIAGTLCAWFSFRHGLSRGLRALPVTAGVTIAALTPLLIAAALRLHAWHHADLRAPEVRIDSALLGAGARRAFLVVHDRSGTSGEPHYAVVADLATGEWEQHGPAMAGFSSAGVLDRGELALPSQLGLHRLIVRLQLATHGRGFVEPHTILDGHSGEQLGAGELPSCAPEALDLLRRERMRNTMLRDRDGRRIWFERDAWYRESRGASPPECLTGVVGRPIRACGIGMQLSVPGLGQQRWFDPVRGRTFDLPAEVRVVILADTWLLRERGMRAGVWIRYDPDTQQRGEQIALGNAHLLDERTLASVDAGSGELCGIAPGTMQRHRIECDAGPGKLVAVAPATWGLQWGLVRAPDGASILWLRYETAPNRWRVAFGRFRDGRIVTTDHADDLTLLGFDGEGALIAIVDHRRIERLRFGGGREVLIPR